MKYDLKKIMKMAWELVKKTKTTLSTALKMAWVVAKKETVFAENENLSRENFTWSIWANYGYVRAYYRCNKWSKYQNSKGNHFVELTGIE